jgi:anti-anti-sigma regulatory factor
VLRLAVPLFWANANQVGIAVLHAVQEQPGTQVLLLDLEATSQLDSTSVDALDVLLIRLREMGVDLYLVRVFSLARDVLERAGFLERLGPDRMWHSISAGVRHAREQLAETGRFVRTTNGDTIEEVDAEEERIAVDHHDEVDRFDDVSYGGDGEDYVEGPDPAVLLAAEVEKAAAEKAEHKKAKKHEKHNDA